MTLVLALLLTLSSGPSLDELARLGVSCDEGLRLAHRRSLQLRGEGVPRSVLACLDQSQGELAALSTLLERVRALIPGTPPQSRAAMAAKFERVIDQLRLISMKAEGCVLADQVGQVTTELEVIKPPARSERLPRVEALAPRPARAPQPAMNDTSKGRGDGLILGVGAALTVGGLGFVMAGWASPDASPERERQATTQRELGASVSALGSLLLLIGMLAF